MTIQSNQQTLALPASPISSTPAGGDNCLNIIVVLLVQGWVVFVYYLHQWIMLLASFEPEAITPPVHLLAGSLKILFVLVPLLLLARFWPHPTFRIVFRTWALAACSLLFFLPASLLNPTAHQARTLLHLPGLALLIVLIFLLDRKYRKSAAPEVDIPGIHPRPTGYQAAGLSSSAGFTSLPWLAWGALGSFFDSLLQLLLGFSLAIAGSLLLEIPFIPPFIGKDGI